MRTFASIDDFCAAVGTHLGESPWMTVDQDRIDTFAEARAKGYTAIFSSADTPGLILDGLIFHRSVIELRADAVRLLLPGEAGRRRPEAVDVGVLRRYDRPQPTMADYDQLLRKWPDTGVIQ